MDARGKTIHGKRPVKGKGSILPPGDLFALGSKPSRPGGETSFPKSSSSSSLSGDKKLDRKRDSTSLLTPAAAIKKPKILAQGQTFTPLGRPADRESDRRASPIPPVSQLYEESAVDVDHAILLTEILSAEAKNDFERVEGLLCGAVRYLHGNRSKPDQLVYLTLMYLARLKPNVFNSEIIIEAFCSLLKRDMSLNFKSKGNPVVSVLACNVMMTSYCEEDNWPDDFVKVYIDDALGERVWVDRADCKGFVDNIATAFNTNLPKGGMISLDAKPEQGSASPLVNVGEEEENKMEVDTDKSASNIGELQNVQVYPRFPYQVDNIETFVMEIIKEQLVKRQLMDASAKSLIRLMTATCGYGEVRLLASQKLELWLQNPKLARAAQELLMSVCMNCVEHDASDMEAMSLLVKMRMKTKPLINHYLNCIRELLTQHPDNLRMVLTHTIYNELSTARNTNNMSLIGVVFQTKPETAPRILAEIFQDLLVNKDDYLRALRALFREIVRSLRHDIDFSSFCLGLMQERSEPKFTDMEPAYRERYMVSVTDLVTMCILQAITPSVREAVAAIARGDKKDIEVLYTFQNLVARIQRDAIWWLHTVVPKCIEAKPQEYVFCMRKMLFMESAEHYTKDNWPAESDKGPMLRLATECPVLEDTLMRVLVIGLSREMALNPQEAVDFADVLIRRAANLHTEGRRVIHVERLELFDALLNLCAYRHPENIALPAGYTPPQLAITNLYWKSWTILLVISAFNPTTFGLAAWENYPMLKCIIEMVMTNNYKFPPPTTAVDDAVIEDVRSQEIQVAQKEKQKILEFEGYLAASTTKVTITEANSLLIAQLTTMDPNGIARKPPQQFMDQIRTLNDTLKIGQMLCRSRKPDFLLDIIQRQGTSQSMPWLAELVESSEGSLDVLPVQCLCEFLLHETQDICKEGVDEDAAKFERHKRKQKIKKQQQLLSRLQTLVHDTDSDSSTTHEVMDYFLKRLSSTQAANRALATKGLSMIISRSQLSPTEEDMTSLGADEIEQKHGWLLTHLPTLPMFTQVKQKTCKALRQAIQIEADPSLVSAYIIFLSQHTTNQSLHELDELALDIAQLIVERTTIINYILPMSTELTSKFSLDTLEALIILFVNYLKKAKEPNTAGYSWSNTQDQIILQWESGVSATMHILVVHSMIILLSYGPAHSKDLYQELLETWFPENSKPPSAFLLDTSEEALLLPDWLKLRMIRSSVELLINAALQDLEPGQLLLFVQSFGIPVHSMSKLLQCLDNAVAMDMFTLEQSVVDKAYMAQLIEVQHKRGAKGGDKFFSMLTDGGKLEIAKGDEEMDTGSSDDAMWRCHKHSDVTMETVPASHVVNTLLQAFDPSGRKSPDAETHFRSLVKSISKKACGALDIAKGLKDIVCGSSGAEFAKCIMQSNKACSLLKLVTSKQNEAGVKSCLNETMEKLSHFSGGQKSAMAAIVHQYLTSQKKRIQKSQTLGGKSQLRMGDETQFMEDLAKLSTSDSGKLESLIGECMKGSMANKDTVTGIKVACTALLENQSESLGGTMLASTAALFVDWLELLDPEVIRQVPDLQEKLLFAKKSVTQSTDGKERQGSSRPYLLALLTHQSSWSTLHRCINSLLSGVKSYDPASTLDFLWACVHIPKIWQGRERKIPKNQAPEDVLGLKGTQLIVLVNYIIQEATSLQSHDINLTNQPSVTINNRMALLTACICNDEDKVKHLVTYIEKMTGIKSDMRSLYEALLLQLYLQYPYLLAWLSDTRCVTSEAQSSDRSETQMDLITHRLIIGLYQGTKSKKNDGKMADVNIACRKLAAEHPVLVLRQLPAIVALLKGKTQFTFGGFRQRNLLSLFTYILGILDLLQPNIFHKEYTVLHDILEEYFNLLQAYSMNFKAMGPIIVKLVAFLNQYVSHDAQRATSLLQKHVILLGNVSSLYPDLSILKSLLAGLTLPRHNQEDVAATTEEANTVMYPARPSSPWSTSHLAPFLQKIKKDNSEEVLNVLQDLDETSKRKIEILGHFVDDLKRLLMIYNDQCRNTAFELIKRYIRNNPKQASDFVPTYLHCLESDNPDIVTSALTNLAEITLLCQDFADVILQKAFSAGINTSIETSSYISESLQLLNLDLASA